MKTFLFDDRGEKWDATSRRLASALCASIGGSELADYAIRNLGYVSVSESNGSVRVRLRPAAVSPIAFSALCYYLMDNKPERIVLSRLDRDWSHEFIGADVNVLRRLVHLVPVNQADRLGDFVSQAKSAEGIASSNPLATLLKLWQEEGGEPLEYERIARLLEQGMSGRYVMVQTGETSSDVFLRAVGPGFLSYDDNWRAHSTGLRVEDQPDYYYGRWVAQAYRDTTSGGSPRLEDVDAIVTTPRIGRSRVRYTRLIVPIKAHAGATCLLGASLIDPDINLRVKAN